MDRVIPSYFSENIQKRSPPENQSRTLMYSELPQIKVSSKSQTTNMNLSKTKVQDRCVDPNSPIFLPNPIQIKKLNKGKIKINIYIFSKKEISKWSVRITKHLGSMIRKHMK